MITRLKVICKSKMEIDGGFYTITFYPVTTGSEENKNFYKWTPTGDISFQTVNPVAADNFKVGKQYYIDFISAE